MQIRIANLNIRVSRDIGGRNLALAACRKRKANRFSGKNLETQLLEIQNYLHHILFYIRNRGKLVLRTFNLNGNNGRSRKREKQNSAQSVTYPCTLSGS